MEPATFLSYSQESTTEFCPQLIESVRIFTLYLFKINFNVILPFVPFYQVVLSQHLPSKILYVWPVGEEWLPVV
jgi:hypothetical protein